MLLNKGDASDFNIFNKKLHKIQNNKQSTILSTIFISFEFKQLLNGYATSVYLLDNSVIFAR